MRRFELKPDTANPSFHVIISLSLYNQIHLMSLPTVQLAQKNFVFPAYYLDNNRSVRICVNFESWNCQNATSSG